MKFDCENSKSDSIFHYTSTETAIQYILPSQKLLCGSYGKSNDPRENKEFSFGGVNAFFPSESHIKHQKDFNNKVSGALKEGSKVLCFSEDYFVDDEWWDGYNLPRMWAQYGDRHRGVCFEISKEKFVQENEFQKNHFLEQVNYTTKNKYPFLNHDNLREVGWESFIHTTRLNRYKYLFFTKHIDWSSERELRLVQFAEESKELFCSIKSSLKRIIVGIDFNKENLKKLKELTGNRIAQVVQDSGKLIALDFKEDYLEKL